MKVQGGERVEQHMCGSRGPSRQSLEQGWENWKGTQEIWIGRRGGGLVFIVVKKSSKAWLARAFPNQAAAKLKRSNCITKITC
jgi:hypothetical protein